MIGKRIKNVRTAAGYSQTELAEMIDVSKQTLYKYENNIVTNVPSDKIEHIALLCNVTPAYIMGWDEDPAAGSTPKQDDVKLSDRAVQIGMAYDRADERTKIGVEVALGIDFEKENVNPTSSSSTLSA